MQIVESSNQHYNAVEAHIKEAMEKFYEVTGRRYEPLEYRYYGSSKPRVAVACMGSGVSVIDGTLKHLESETTCLLAIRTFRPWNRKRFIDFLPESVTRIAVLDRTREGGSQGEPLYMDICTSLMQEGKGDIFVAGGRYGLGSKDFTPRMVSAIMQNMLRKNVEDIQRPFTVGINDDVTKLSLPLGRHLNILDPNVTQCVFWGFGSDGKQCSGLLSNSAAARSAVLYEMHRNRWSQQIGSEAHRKLPQRHVGAGILRVRRKEKQWLDYFALAFLAMCINFCAFSCRRESS